MELLFSEMNILKQSVNAEAQLFDTQNESRMGNYVKVHGNMSVLAVCEY